MDTNFEAYDRLKNNLETRENLLTYSAKYITKNVLTTAVILIQSLYSIILFYHLQPTTRFET